MMLHHRSHRVHIPEHILIWRHHGLTNSGFGCEAGQENLWCIDNDLLHSFVAPDVTAVQAKAQMLHGRRQCLQRPMLHVPVFQYVLQGPMFVP